MEENKEFTDETTILEPNTQNDTFGENDATEPKAPVQPDTYEAPELEPQRSNLKAMPVTPEFKGWSLNLGDNPMQPQQQAQVSPEPQSVQPNYCGQTVQPQSPIQPQSPVQSQPPVQPQYTRQEAPAYTQPQYNNEQEAPTYEQPQYTRQEAPAYTQPQYNNQQTTPTYVQPQYNQQATPTYAQPQYSQQEAPAYTQPQYNNQQTTPTYVQPQYNQQTTPPYTSSPYGQPVYNQPAPPVKEKKDSIGFGIASMVLGISSVLLFCTCFNIVTAILAVIFGIIQLVKNKNKVFAIVGISTAAVSIILTIIFWAAVGSNIENSYDPYDHDYWYYRNYDLQDDIY